MTVEELVFHIMDKFVNTDIFNEERLYDASLFNWVAGFCPSCTVITVVEAANKVREIYRESLEEETLYD